MSAREDMLLDFISALLLAHHDRDEYIATRLSVLRHNVNPECRHVVEHLIRELNPHLSSGWHEKPFSRKAPTK